MQKGRESGFREGPSPGSDLVWSGLVGDLVRSPTLVKRQHRPIYQEMIRLYTRVYLEVQFLCNAIQDAIQKAYRYQMSVHLMFVSIKWGLKRMDQRPRDCGQHLKLQVAFLRAFMVPRRRVTSSAYRSDCRNMNRGARKHYWFCLNRACSSSHRRKWHNTQQYFPISATMWHKGARWVVLQSSFLLFAAAAAYLNLEGLQYVTIMRVLSPALNISTPWHCIEQSDIIGHTNCSNQRCV